MNFQFACGIWFGHWRRKLLRKHTQTDKHVFCGKSYRLLICICVCMYRICPFDGRNCGNNCLQTTQVEARKAAQQANSIKQQVFMVKENEWSLHTHTHKHKYLHTTHACICECVWNIFLMQFQFQQLQLLLQAVVAAGKESWLFDQILYTSRQSSVSLRPFLRQSASELVVSAIIVFG